MRLAAIIIETDEQPMLMACATHKPALDEWVWAAGIAGHPVSEGVTFGDCPIPGDIHEEFND